MLAHTDAAAVQPALESMMTLLGARYGGIYRKIENVVPGIVGYEFHAIIPATVDVVVSRYGGTIMSVYKLRLSEDDDVT